MGGRNSYLVAHLESRTALKHLLFWSIIAAAFIGPGTVTTAAKAGAAFGPGLLWALWFSTLATLVLQEAAARLPMLTGLNLGQAIAQRFAGRRQRLVRGLLAGAVVFGCAAYQTGNLLGALLGLRLIWPTLGSWALLPLGALAALLLWQGRLQRIARGLGLLVAAMGLMFICVASQTPLAAGAMLRGSLLPQLPAGSEWLVIALVGTTIVPYNLFLGSGLPHGQSLRQMRLGLGLAVGLGGVISAAILLVGTQVQGAFSLAGLSQAIGAEVGAVAQGLFAWGLFAAGFTSATTAPLAAALTASGVWGDAHPRWQPQGRAFRLVWGGVLGVGLLFGLLDLPPVPAIILAQALNGLLLPAVAVFLYRLINDRSLIPAGHRNASWLNGLTLLVVGVALLLGLLNLSRAAGRVLGVDVGEGWLPWLGGICALLVAAVAWRGGKQDM